MSGHIGHGEHPFTSIILFHPTSDSSVISLTFSSRAASYMPRIIPFLNPCTTSASFSPTILPYLSARAASFALLSHPFHFHIHSTYTACNTHSLLRHSVHSLLMHRQSSLCLEGRRKMVGKRIEENCAILEEDVANLCPRKAKIVKRMIEKCIQNEDIYLAVLAWHNVPREG